MKAQRGVALIALVAVLVLGASWYLVSALNAASNRTAVKRVQNAKLLAEAKQALLGYVASLAADTTEKFPGRLPCPEPSGHIGNANYEGVTAPYVPSGQATCSNIGRLPWRTLGIDRPRDADGEALWYVVTIGTSGWALQTSATDLSINSNKLGGLTIDGVANAAVAAIIAPGKPMNIAPTANQIALGCAARSQSRTPSPPDYLDYLECQNIAGASLRTGVTDNASNEALNDQMVVITAAEVMAAIEGAVAQRILSQVVPQISAIYASSTWGAGVSSTAPIFPFPARFTNTAASTFNPESYQGRRYSDDANTVTNTQGLLPLYAYTCDSTLPNTAWCGTSFVNWNTGLVAATVTVTLPTTYTQTCAASTAALINCTITYSRTCSGGFGTCNTGVPSVHVTGSANNIGMAMRTLTGSPQSLVTGFNGSPTWDSPNTIGTDGAASVGVNGTLAAKTCIYFFSSCTASGSATITIPLTVFPDHAFLHPATTDNWYWFMKNKWYEVTYFAVAPSHLPSGATHNCSTSSDCLTVTGGTTASGNKALLVLMGRSLTNVSRPNTSLADYLDNTENRNLDTAFTQSKFGKTFNDHFVTISNY